MTTESSPRTAVVRRVLASLCLLAALLAWAPSLVRSEPIPLVLSVVLVLSAVLLHVPHVGAQVLVRASAWAQFGLGVLAAALGGHREPTVLAAGTGVGLLLLGGSHLGTARALRQFGPIGYRRAFLFACVLLLGAAEVLGIGAWQWLHDHQRRAAVLSVLESLLLVASVAGVLRGRAWGVLVAGVASLIGGAAALAATLPATRAMLGVTYGSDVARVVFGAAAVVALLMPLPVLVSRVAPARPRATSASRLGWLQTLLLAGGIGLALAGFFAGGLRSFLG